MAILHGSWIGSSSSQRPAQAGYFFVWGETWRRIEPIAPADTPPIHPFAMDRDELKDLLRSRPLHWTVAAVDLATTSETAPAKTNRRTKKQETEVEQNGDRWQTLTVGLPTYQIAPGRIVPQHSAADTLESNPSDAPEEEHTKQPELTLQPWQIQGIRLTATEALNLLESLPLSSVQSEEFAWLGDDLRFWSHVARWHLDLLARTKFLPTLESIDPDSTAPSQPEQLTSHWQVLLDSSIDQARLERFARGMPGICRTYDLTNLGETNLGETDDGRAIAPPHPLLLSFLDQVINTQVRTISAAQSLPTVNLPKDLNLRDWLQVLGQEYPVAAVPLMKVKGAIAQWLKPLQDQLQIDFTAQWRTCFYLHPPRGQATDWTLEYFLQAIHQPDFLLSARTIWSNPVEQLAYMGRTVNQPQEKLLAGLGLASRLYSVLEPSLQVSQPQACQLHPLQVYEFIKNNAWRLQDGGFGVILPPSLSSQNGWANRIGLSVRAEAPKPGKQLGLQSLLNFKWELTIGGQRLSKSEFERLVALNTPLVEINGEWVEFRQQDIKAAQSFFASRKDQLSLSIEDALRISTGDTQMVEKLPVVNFEASGTLQQLLDTVTGNNQSVDLIPTPKDLQGELRPYQLRGTSWLSFLQQWGLGACLADDMGLGKTVQFIAFMLHLKEQEMLEQPTLLVCPTSVLGNWEREVKRFAPSLRILVHHGDKRSQSTKFKTAVQTKDLIITSYALIHRDLKSLQSIPWQGVVLDEAQNIKNADSKQSQSIRQLEAGFRIALTGTPVENRLTELWSIMDFLNPGYLGPKNFFQRRFAVPIERYGDTDSLKTLRSLVQPFILRRLKSDRTIIQDLPDKQEMTVFCGLTTDQAALYQTMVERSLAEIESAEGIQQKGMILALLTKLKQVCNHPYLLKSEQASEQVFEQASLEHHSGKLQRLEAMLEEVLAEGDRCLIFTQFAEWGKLLQAHLEKRFQREILFLYGSTSKPQREAMIDRFQNDPQGPRIFILSLKAGGVGLNLTRANHVFHFDRWWNPAVENQATDRVFRIGQTKNVQVHKFVCTGTLEERIHEIIERKKALSEQIVGTGESWLTELDTNALRSLLLLDRTAVIEEDDED
jgi:SNF2 family DNA or RNA helicase